MCQIWLLMVAFCIHQGKNSCLPTLSMTERFQRSLYWEYFLPQLLENGSFPILVASSLFFAFVYGYMFFRACWKPQKVLSHALWGHGKHFPRTCGILLSSREFYKLLVSQYIHNTLFPSWINQEYPLKKCFKKLSCRLKISRLSCWLNALNHNVYIHSFLS